MNGAAGEKIWKSLVYNVDITSDQVKNFYKSWAGTYEEDMNRLNFTGAGLLADMLTAAMSRSGRQDPSKMTVMDVACGTGTVGAALSRRGFRTISGLDFSGEMLERAWEKDVYSELVECSFGVEVPESLSGRTFDCVVMMGGFAAGHIPLASLATMAKLCKPGGIVVNMMTQKYTQIVDEYRGIDTYVFRLAEEGLWRVEERREVEHYGGGNRGLVHLLRVL